MIMGMIVGVGIFFIGMVTATVVLLLVASGRQSEEE